MSIEFKTSVKLPSIVVILALLAIPLSLSWRPHLFFVIDDWSALHDMVGYPFWQYLNQTDAEQWFPFFHLCYYLLIKISGENYNILVIVNCLGTGVNAFLVYLFLRRNLAEWPALVLSLVYCVAVVHGAIIWHAYNLCYLLAFGFFMGALLLADAYLAVPTRGRLVGLGGCALLAILSHSFAIMALAAIPLYAFLLGDRKAICWRVALVIGLVYLVFAAGYATFAGITPASSQNQQILSRFPGPSYWLYILYGAFLFPFYFLLGGTIIAYKVLWAPILGGLSLAVLLPLIFFKGDSRARRLALWVILMNPTFFLLVGLARYQMTISQAGSLRYGIFSIVGPLLLAGLAWQTLNRPPQRQWTRLLGLSLLGLIFSVQVAADLNLKEEYRRLSETTRLAYQNLDNQLNGAPHQEQEAASQLFCPQTHPWLTRAQAQKIQRYLRGNLPGR